MFRKPERSCSTARPPTVWCVKCRLGARTSKSKAKPAFPIHSILSSTSSAAITTVTSFGGRHAESALHLISCVLPSYYSLGAKRSCSSLHRHSLNLRHVVVKNGLHATIIPFDRYARPIRFSDGAKIGHGGSPANTVAYFEKPGLFTGHLRFTLGGSTSSTRLISLWPVKL